MEHLDEANQFILSEAEYVLRDIDIDTDYELTVKVVGSPEKRISTTDRLARAGHRFYACVRSASESFKKNIHNHQDIEFGNPLINQVFC